MSSCFGGIPGNYLSFTQQPTPLATIDASITFLKEMLNAFDVKLTEFISAFMVRIDNALANLSVKFDTAFSAHISALQVIVDRLDRNSIYHIGAYIERIKALEERINSNIVRIHNGNTGGGGVNISVNCPNTGVGVPDIRHNKANEGAGKEQEPKEPAAEQFIAAERKVICDPDDKVFVFDDVNKKAIIVPARELPKYLNKHGSKRTFPDAQIAELLPRVNAEVNEKGFMAIPNVGLLDVEFIEDCLDIEIDKTKPPEEQIKEASKRLEVEKLASGAEAWALDWGNTLICEVLAKISSSPLQSSDNPFAYLMGTRHNDGSTRIPDPLDEAWDSGNAITRPFINLFIKVWRGISDVIDNIFQQFFKNLPCDPRKIVLPSVIRGLYGIVERWAGFKIPKLEESLQRYIDYQCPTGIPSQAEVDNMKLSKVITDDIWECLTKANNNVVNWQKQSVEASRAKLTSDDIIRLMLRDSLSPDEAKKRLGELGYTRDSEIGELLKLAEGVPTISDLIPYLTRDVFDEQVVKDFGYDAEFEKKFDARAEKLFKANGFGKEFARLVWRSHWVNPSNTQLFSMYHRLRGQPGSTGVKRYFDEKGNPLAVPIEVMHSEVKVTEEQIARALGINDVMPFWRDKILAISRPPLTRTDARRAFEIDSITREQLKDSFMDLGYSETNAEILTKFSDKLKERAKVRKQSRLSPAKVSGLYRNHAIKRNDAEALLITNGLTAEDAKIVIEQASVEREARAREKCLRAIRKRYMIGDIDANGLVKMLQEQGLENDQVTVLAKEFACDLANKAKEVTAQMLCKWHGFKLIDDKTFKMRLVRIGYAESDADNIVSACIEEKEEKEAKKKK